MPEKYVRLFEAYFSLTQVRVRPHNAEPKSYPLIFVFFKAFLSPVLLNHAIDWIMRRSLNNPVKVVGSLIPNSSTTLLFWERGLQLVLNWIAFEDAVLKTKFFRISQDFS